MHQIFCGVNLNSQTKPILFVLCSNKPHMVIFKKKIILRTSINLTCTKDYKLQLGHYSYGSLNCQAHWQTLSKIIVCATSKKKTFDPSK